MVIIVLNVGANTAPKWGGFRSPIYSDGKFRFVPIPLKDHYIVDPPAIAPTYRCLGLEGIVPEDKLDSRALLSPDFKNLAYGHLRRPSDGNAFQQLKNEGGYLFFYATLRHMSTINPDWGAYLIGYFSTEFVVSDRELAERPEVQRRLENYAWYQTRTRDGREAAAHWWITGSSGGLFRRAIPLSKNSNPNEWNAFALKTLRTTTGKRLPQRAFYNWTLKVAEEEEKYFWQEISKHNPDGNCERRYV